MGDCRMATASATISSLELTKSSKTSLNFSLSVFMRSFRGARLRFDFVCRLEKTPRLRLRCRWIPAISSGLHSRQVCLDLRSYHRLVLDRPARQVCCDRAWSIAQSARGREERWLVDLDYRIALFCPF